MNHNVDTKKDTLSKLFQSCKQENNVINRQESLIMFNLLNIDNALNNQTSSQPIDVEKTVSYVTKVKESFINFIKTVYNITFKINVKDEFVNPMESISEKLMIFTQCMSDFVKYDPNSSKKFADSLPMHKIESLMSFLKIDISSLSKKMPTC